MKNTNEKFILTRSLSDELIISEIDYSNVRISEKEIVFSIIIHTKNDERNYINFVTNFTHEKVRIFASKTEKQLKDFMSVPLVFQIKD